MRRFLTVPVMVACALLALLVTSGVKPAQAVAPNPTTIPVVFVPGIAGSRLADSNNAEYWTAAGYPDHDDLTLYPNTPHPTLYATSALTQATFLGVHIPYADYQTYGPFLTYLGTQGFVQYNTYQNPYLQTSAGCDLTQASNNPNLFVFAYDWRISNAANATLLADYIACVRKFYPGTNVNLVVHSMGGLVARRYILQYNTNNYVNALISVGSPWLGAPKMVWIEETGSFIFFLWASTVINVIPSFNGASELLSTQAWYDMGGAPVLVEDGQDLNGNGKYDEQFTYPMLVQYMDKAKGQQGFLPGTQNQTFNSYTNGGNQQDDWRNDTTGVKYFHIVGEGLVPDTVGQVVAASLWKCLKNFTICNLSTWMYPKFTQGDGTVAALSAARINGTLSYNAPNATVYKCQAFGANNQNVDHHGMLNNIVVRTLLLGYLTQANGGEAPNPPPGLQCGNGVLPPLGAENQANAGEGSVQPSKLNRLTLSGVKNVQVSDGTDNPNPDGSARYDISEDSVLLLLADEKTYDVTFEMTGDPLYMEWRHQKGEKLKKVARVLDQPVKANAQGHVTVGGAKLSTVEYDANHDNLYETELLKDVVLKGKMARDQKPPTLDVQLLRGSSRKVAVTATDEGAGLARILYSFDQQHFNLYTGPIQVKPGAKKVYFLADDKAGNRTDLITFTLP